MNYLQYIRSLKNFMAEQPYQHAVYYLAVLLAEQAWVKDELLEATACEYIEAYQEILKFPLLDSVIIPFMKNILSNYNYHIKLNFI